ncbi:STAS domain-containing protein [Sinosporangium siamense]|uniref:STAS domain-containing protein n=1 Tax=Sinosporangium siamense TaxID=1367973 RepID=A0A919V8I6_9ACTN|nr:STAS domain-containing protein [Sinosporangium siamense]GII94488.1 hypothetical protein Ssi02_47190 [Sinosporangium siamense]
MSRLLAAVADYRPCTVISLWGELDMESAALVEYLVAQALEGGRVRLVVDAARLEFCDWAGLEALLAARDRAAAAGGSLRLAFVHGQVRRLVGTGQACRVVPADAELVALDW